MRQSVYASNSTFLDHNNIIIRNVASQLIESHDSCFYCCVAVQLSGAEALLTDQVMSELCIKSKYQPASEIWKGTMATGARYSLTIPCCVR